MSVIAFRLHDDYQPVSEDNPEGFTGGVLHTDQGDIHVLDEVAAGNGMIVVDAARDSAVCELLRAYPATEEVPTADIPDGASPISPYERKSLPQLQAIAKARQLDQADTTSHARLVSVLHEHDNAVDKQAADEQAAYDELPDHKLEPLSKAELLRIVALKGGVYANSRNTKQVIITALVAAGVTDPAQVPDPYEGLDEDDLVELADHHNLEIDDNADELDLITALAAAGVTPDQEA